MAFRIYFRALNLIPTYIHKLYDNIIRKIVAKMYRNAAISFMLLFSDENILQSAEIKLIETI